MRNEQRGFVKGVLATIVLAAFLFSGITAFADGTRTIEAGVNAVKIFVNGQQMQADNFVYDGRTYIQLREICELLKKDIVWDEKTLTVYITDLKTPSKPTTIIPYKDIQDSQTGSTTPSSPPNNPPTTPLPSTPNTDQKVPLIDNFLLRTNLGGKCLDNNFGISNTATDSFKLTLGTKYYVEFTKAVNIKDMEISSDNAVFGFEFFNASGGIVATANFPSEEVMNKMGRRSLDLNISGISKVIVSVVKEVPNSTGNWLGEIEFYGN